MRSIARDAGLPASTLNKWSKDYKTIPVYGIVAICNVLRVSISSLVTNEKGDELSSYHDLYISEDKFQPLIYDMDAIGNIYKKQGLAKVTKKDFVKKMGVYDNTVSNWQRSEKALRLHTLIDICNIFDLNINYFIIDPNKKADSPVNDNSRNGVAMIYKMQEDLKISKFDNQQKDKLISTLTKEVDLLKEENNLLRKIYLMPGKTYSAQESASQIVSDNKSHCFGIASEMPKRVRYIFNKFLFKSLPALSGISIDAISSLCKLSPVYIEEGSDEFRFSRLVALCNKLHISIRHFFLAEGELYMVGHPEEYFSDANLFHRISYLPENIASLAGNGGVLQLSRALFCDTIGISQSTLSQWIKEERQSTLSVNGMLRICNAYHICPDMFFDDSNPISMRSYPISPEDMLFTENLLLKKLIKDQEKELKDLKTEIK